MPKTVLAAQAKANMYGYKVWQIDMCSFPTLVFVPALVFVLVKVESAEVRIRSRQVFVVGSIA
jgi:hypothetical protein